MMAVVVELEPEGSPCGDAGIAQSQIGIYEIEVIMQTFGVHRPEIGFSVFLVVPRLLGTTQFHRRKNVNQAWMLASLSHNFFYPFFLTKAFLADEIDLEAIFICQSLGISPDFLSQRLGSLGIIKDADAVVIQIAGHSCGVANAGDRPGEDHSVKNRQIAANLGGMTVWKKCHGKTFLSNFEEPVLQIIKTA